MDLLERPRIHTFIINATLGFTQGPYKASSSVLVIFTFTFAISAIVSSHHFLYVILPAEVATYTGLAVEAPIYLSFLKL